MDWKVRREFLRRLDIFAGLGDRDLKVLAKSCSEASYADGELLCRQGDRGVAAFVILSGRVQVEEELGGGRLRIIALLGQGEIVGELSVIDGAERVANLRALGDCEVLVLTQWAMKALIEDRPTIAAAMLPVIVRRFRETAEALRRLTSREERATRDSIVR